MKLIEQTALEYIRSIGRKKNKDSLGRLVKIYCQSTEVQIVELEQAISEKNLKAVIEIVHPFKSSSAQLGAMPLKQALEEIERLALESNDMGEQWNPEIGKHISPTKELHEDTLKVLLSEAKLA